jgi:lipopolysaccharide export system protein LptA
MTVRNQENRAVFEGAVVLTHGPLVVHSDMMVVSFKSVGADANGAAPTPATEPGPRAGKLPTMSNRSVSLIEATGRVKIYKEDGQATCRKAVYHGDEEKLVLTGDPIAWQKGAKVSGKKITMYLAEDRSVVEGESRVMIQQETAGR